MASASGPGDVLQASEGKTRFVRLVRLLVCGGTTVMRELFDYLIPPANLAAVLSSPAVKTRLTDMRNKRILTSPQWDKLYPLSGSVQSVSFDITLLFKLLRENVISGLSAPSLGWDKLPNISDTSLPADMARIKYFRNGIAHGDEKMELSEQEFSDYWKEIKDALVRIVGHYATSGSSTVTDWEMAIDRLLTDPLTEDDRKNVEELKSWYLDERDLKEMVDDVKVLLESLKNDRKVFSARIVGKLSTIGFWLGGNIYILNLLKDHPDLLVEYVLYGIIPSGIMVCYFAFGSIKLSLRVETLDALDEFWKRYKTGQLKDDFEKVLITEELKNLANGETIELGVEINEEELMEIRKLLAKEEAIQETVKSFCFLPPKPSHQIINRLVEVERLLNKIKHKTTNEVTVIYLSGNPGCGKSELARQVGETFYTNIAGQTTGAKFVFTFNASSIETLIHSYIEFTRILGCPKEAIARVVASEDASLEVKIMRLKGLAAPNLEKYSSWLMIVDNVTDLEVVSRYFPRKEEKTTGNGQVLVTTEDKEAMAVDSKCTFFVSINTGMRTVDAHETLKEISTFSSEQTIVSEVAKALDYQPLALACAALYMRNVASEESSMTWSKFLVEHKYAKAAAETNTKTSSIYPSSMTAVVMVALENEMSDSMLMRAFQFLSMMAPEPISLEYIIQYVKICKPDANDQVVAARISSSSLVRISADGSVVSVHQVVHDCLQTFISQHKEIDADLLQLLKMLKAFPFLSSYKTEELDNIFATSSLLIHFVTYVRKLQQYVEESLTSEMLSKILLDTKDDTANTLSLVGDICYSYGYHIASKICSEISSAIQKGALDAKDLRVVSTMKKLAHINLVVGRHQEAIKCFERALTIQENKHGHHDPSLVHTLNELGSSHRDLGQFHEAIKCFERALAIQEKAYGQDDPHLVSELIELGRCHRDLGQDQDAIKCFERALDILEKEYGNNDLRLVSELNELGRYYRELGLHRKAIKYFERALAILEKAYGDDDSHLVSELNILGRYHRDLEQHQEATKCFERALAIQENKYGYHDPRLVYMLNRLEFSYRDLRQHQEAINCLDRALYILEQCGHDDPYIVSELNELGRYYRKQKYPQEATKCFERALAIQEKSMITMILV